MGSNNVFTWPFRARYYIMHPWEWLRTLFGNIKCAWQRATKGYCDYDICDMENYFLILIPEMLEAMATDEIQAYPGNDEFDTFEKWQDWLMGLAGEFKELREMDSDELTDKRNEYADEYFKKLREVRKTIRENSMVRVTYEEDEDFKVIKELYWDRMRELEREKIEKTDKAFAHLAKHFYALWI